MKIYLTEVDFILLEYLEPNEKKFASFFIGIVVISSVGLLSDRQTILIRVTPQNMTEIVLRECNVSTYIISIPDSRYEKSLRWEFCGWKTYVYLWYGVGMVNNLMMPAIYYLRLILSILSKAKHDMSCWQTNVDGLVVALGVVVKPNWAT